MLASPSPTLPATTWQRHWTAARSRPEKRSPSATRSRFVRSRQGRRSCASACRSASRRCRSMRDGWCMCIMSAAGISTMTRTTMSDASAPVPSLPAFPAGAAAMRGYLRADGRKGIRNYVVVAYLVECAHHVARKIVTPFEEAGAQLIGFPGCYPSAYAHRVIESLCTHPNVGAVLIVSLGCEEFRRSALKETVAASGRAVELLVIQEEGGTTATIEAGRAWLAARLDEAADAPTVPVAFSDLVIGTKCGGSDGLSGVTANPAVGSAF